MKTFLTLVTMVLALQAKADTQIVYGGGETETKDTVLFFDKGEHFEVKANLVCVTADEKTFKTHVAAHEYRKCLASYVDHSDSTRPRTVCTKSEVVRVPAQDLSTPVTYTHQACVKWSVDHSDSAYPKKTCLEVGQVTETRSLMYTQLHYRVGDYRHESPSYSRERFPTCK